MDFKRYAKNNEGADDNGDVKKKFDETVKRTQGKSEAELMQEIIRQAASEKSAGRLTDDDLKRFYETVAPMLDKSQTGKLKEILNLIK